MFMPVTKSGGSSSTKDKPGDGRLARRASMATPGNNNRRESIFDNFNCQGPGSNMFDQNQIPSGRKQSLDGPGKLTRRASFVDSNNDHLGRDFTLDGISLDNALLDNNRFKTNESGGSSATKPASKKLQDVVRKKIMPANLFKSAISKKLLTKPADDSEGSSGSKTGLATVAEDSSEQKSQNKTSSKDNSGSETPPSKRDGTSGSVSSSLFRFVFLPRPSRLLRRSLDLLSPECWGLTRREEPKLV